MSQEHIMKCLRDRIEKVKQWDVCSFPEMQGKRAIIEPILECLGWDTSNPSEVRLEYPVIPSRDRVDYALLKGKKPIVLIEAKKPGQSLDNSNYGSQLLKYAWQKGTPLAILSNGIEWWFYLGIGEGDWQERKFLAIDLNTQDIEKACSRFVEFLSKDNVMSGTAVERAKEKKFKTEIELEIQKTLPIVWDTIITEPNETLVELLIKETEKRCGYEPDVSQVKSFLKKPVTESIPITRPKTTNLRQSSGEQFVLPVGLQLHKKYKGKRFTAVTLDNNQIRLDLDGKTYSLNQGTIVCIQSIRPDRDSEDAWRWWKFSDPETREEKVIDVLKKKK